jgi:hypothetical protein
MSQMFSTNNFFSNYPEYTYGDVFSCRKWDKFEAYVLAKPFVVFVNIYGRPKFYFFIFYIFFFEVTIRFL